MGQRLAAVKRTGRFERIEAAGPWEGSELSMRLSLGQLTPELAEEIQKSLAVTLPMSSTALRERE